MVSTIAENRPNEFMSFKHVGVIKNGVEDLNCKEMEDWSGATENYTLQTVNGRTELKVEMDFKSLPKDMLDYFMSTWPKALAKLKELVEKN
jgi:hypothetical protein